MQKFENTLWSGECSFGEMSQWGNVQSGKCPVGELPFGEMSVGEVSDGDLPSGKCQLGKCPVGKLSYNRLKQSSGGVLNISQKSQENTCLCQNLFLIKLQISASLPRFCNFEYAIISQLTFTCSMPTKETLEKEVKWQDQVNLLVYGHGGPYFLF